MELASEEPFPGPLFDPPPAHKIKLKVLKKLKKNANTH